MRVEDADRASTREILVLQSRTMRSLSILALALAAAGCGTHGGPSLPPDVGADHADEGGEEVADDTPDEAPPEPVAIGTPVWANYHDTGFYFHGVVVERNEAMHRVIYTDGASEWLPAESLLPDSLHEDAQVDVRLTMGGEFQTATVGRRIGDALYVRLANGDERWTALPHVRFQAGDPGIQARGDAAFTQSASQAGDVGSSVLVNYELQGLLFPATVTALGGDGRAYVVYEDGESGWAPRGTFTGDNVAEGTVVHVRRSWDPPDWVRGRVEQRHGHALRVVFDDGGVAWTSMVRVRVPTEEPAAAEQAPAAAEPAQPPDEARPARRRHR